MKFGLSTALVAGLLVVSAMATSASAQCAPGMGAGPAAKCDPSAKTVVQVVLAVPVTLGNADIVNAAGGVQGAIMRTASPQFTFSPSVNDPNAITATLYASGPSAPPIITMSITADFAAPNGNKAASRAICRTPIKPWNTPRADYGLTITDQAGCAAAFMAALKDFASQGMAPGLRTPVRIMAATGDPHESVLASALKTALQTSPNFADIANINPAFNSVAPIVVTIQNHGSTDLRLRYAVQLSGPGGTTITSAECPSSAVDGCVAEVIQAASAYQTAMGQKKL